jgi:hypothetical protein
MQVDWLVSDHLKKKTPFPALSAEGLEDRVRKKINVLQYKSLLIGEHMCAL